MGEQKTLAELGALVVGVEQVANLSIAGHSVDCQVEKVVRLLLLAALFVNTLHDQFHEGHDIEYLCYIFFNLSRLTFEILDLLLGLKEESFLSTAKELHVESRGTGCCEHCNGK